MLGTLDYSFNFQTSPMKYDGLRTKRKKGYITNSYIPSNIPQHIILKE